MRQSLWTPSEIAILKKFYPQMTARELKSRFFLNRSMSAIQQRTYLLKLSKQQRTTFDFHLLSGGGVCYNLGLGYVIGVLLGDGCLTVDKHSHYMIKMDTVSKDFAERFVQNVKETLSELGMTNKVQWCEYNKRSYRKYLPRLKVDGKVSHFYSVRVCSRPFYGFLKEKVDSILRNCFEVEDEHFVRGIVKGFYDSEGWCSLAYGKYYWIGMSNTNLNLLRFIRYLLSKLGIVISNIYRKKSGTNKQMYELEIYRQKEVEKFRRIIGDKFSSF